jgi:beta-glucosidase
METAAPSTAFPEDFAWGAISSAFQWEGAAFEDGKGASIWDMYTRKPGAIRGDDKLDVSSDGYHRFEEDVALMKQIGLRAHDLSISWPRVLPDGTGTPNEKGLDFYDRFIDVLLDAGIEPWVDLYHWDMPLALYHRGSWLNRDIAGWFADYTSLVVERFSDRVSHWITFTEPQVIIGMGHGAGGSAAEAPGDDWPLAEVLRGSHNLLRSHGMAVQAIRAASRQPARVGYSPVGSIRMPESDTPKDLEAARRAMFSVIRPDVENNTWWSDPMFLGAYPEDGWELFGADVPEIEPGDMETIAQPLDLYGMNVYSGHSVRHAEVGWERIPNPPDGPMNSLGWPINPAVMYWGPRLLHERYGAPIVITENGLCSHDWVALDGGVHDPLRIDFTRRHLLELERAITDGVPVEGYFHWTWVDNFECTEGFRARFGMVHCDFQTLERTLKDSAHWYAEVIRTNGGSLHVDPQVG